MAWYNEKGDLQDVVISTRVRFARNLDDYPFPSRLSDSLAGEIIDKVSSVLPDYSCERFSSGDKGKLRSYMEMHFISPEFMSSNRQRALVSGENERIKIMLCEEDHIRIQSIVAGFEPQLAFESAVKADDLICKSLKIGYSEKYGYLTACPTNLGAAMRVSAMLCLPGLTARGLIEGYGKAMSKLGITIRGLYGEGSRASGYIYQISNRASLGIAETEILKLIGDVVKNLVEAERKARQDLFDFKKDAVMDKTARSIGMLKVAHLLPSSEFISAFSDIKMGLSLGIAEGITDEKLSELLVAVQPGTLSLMKEGLDKEDLRDIKRAELIREAFSSVKINY